MEECSMLTGLIIDLKKRELGREHQPITMERLEEASKAIGKLRQSENSSNAENKDFFDETPATIQVETDGRCIRGQSAKSTTNDSGSQ
jgi:hypothetical protein